jgi:hypothetical protein
MQCVKLTNRYTGYILRHRSIGRMMVEVNAHPKPSANYLPGQCIRLVNWALSSSEILEQVLDCVNRMQVRYIRSFVKLLRSSLNLLYRLTLICIPVRQEGTLLTIEDITTGKPKP